MSTDMKSSHFLKSQGLWLMDVAATFPFSLCDAHNQQESKCIPQTQSQTPVHSHGHIWQRLIGHRHVRSHRGPQIQCDHREGVAPAAPTVKTHTTHRHTGTRPLFLLGWQRQKVTVQHTPVQHTAHTAQVQNTHTFMSSPSMVTLPVLAQHCYEDSSTPYLPRGSLTHCCVLAAHTQHSHIHPTGTPCSQVPLNTSIHPSPWHLCLDKGHPAHLVGQTGVTLLHVNGPFYTLFDLPLLWSSLICFPCTVLPDLV